MFKMRKLSRLIFPALILCLFLALAVKAEIKKIERFDNGWLIYRAWVDENNNPAMGDEGYSSMVLQLDNAYRPVLTSYFDTKGEPVDLPAGYSVLSKSYTGLGWVKEEEYFDAKGEPVIPREKGYARMLNTYIGRKLFSVEYFGADGKYIIPEGLFAKREDYYNKRGLLARREFFDETSARMLGGDGYAIGEWDQPSSRQLFSERFFGVDEKPIVGTAGYATQINTYGSASRRLLSRAFYDADDQLVINPKLDYSLLPVGVSAGTPASCAFERQPQKVRG